MRLRLHNPWPARQAEYLLRWWPAGSHPPPEGARWWPAGAPEPVGRADTNKGDVTTTNIKADTGDTEKAEHSSPQLPIDKQEHEEMHTSNSDSNAQHTSNTADTGDTDKSSAQVGTNTTEGQPITEAQGR